MSFTPVERRVSPRLYRSKLFVPGSQTKFFEKAAAGPADVVCLDLEDAVAPSDKDKVRDNIVQALNDVNWGNKLVTVRKRLPDTRGDRLGIVGVDADRGVSAGLVEGRV